ncbi:MAG: outer membrane protein transport protein [Pseudomonas marincola]|uniref:OmpP1/FadL family transporter n=1 Tax=Pseudomonas marincola TaxID=437900 RepID=UPI0030016BE7
MQLRKSLMALSILGAAGNAWAGGIMVYEAGQEGAGLANAGAAVLATDPSVMMNNPAGISELKGTQFTANAQIIAGDMRFSRDADNTFSGSEGGQPLKYFPGSSLFISHEINDRASIGFGMFGTFGLMLDYDDDWAGRYFSQESAVVGVTFQPTFSYRVNDDLSVGIGPRIMYGYYRSETGINNNVLGVNNADDGQLRYKDTDWAMGMSIGALYNLTPTTKVGLAYTSKIKLEFEDRPELKNVSNPILNLALNRLDANGLNIDMEVPQTVLLSVSQQLDGGWTLLGSAGWQDWSEFGKLGIAVDGGATGASTKVLADRKYKDTWHLSVGAQKQVNDKLRLNMGVGYDSSAVEDEDRTVDNPMNEVWRLAAGFNYALADDVDMHMSYTLIYMGDMDIDQTKERTGQKLSGEYSDAMLHVLGGGVTWRF